MGLKHTFLALATLILLVFSSCKKCMECSYKSLEGKVVIEQQCGNSDEISDFEKRVRLESNEQRDPAKCNHSR